MPNFNTHATIGEVSSAVVNYLIVNEYWGWFLAAGFIGASIPDSIEQVKYYGHYDHRKFFHSKKLLIILIPILLVFALIYYLFF